MILHIKKFNAGSVGKRSALLGLCLLIFIAAGAVPLSRLVNQPVFAADTVTTNSLPFTPTTFASSADGTYIVATQNDNNHAAYYSSDSGATWNLTSTTFGSTPAQTLVASTDGQTLFGIGGTTQRSVDGGKNWTFSSLVQPYYSNMTYASGTGKIYAMLSDGSGIIVSSDFGNTWTAVYTVPTGYSLSGVSVSRDGTRLYDVLVNNSTFTTVVNLSTDDGASWAPFYQSSDPNRIAISVQANGDDSLALVGIYNLTLNDVDAYIVSTDSGATWNNMTTPLPNSTAFSLFYFGSSGEYNYASGNTLYHVNTTSASHVTSSANVGGQSLENNPTISSQPTFSGVTDPLAQVTVTVHSDPVTCTTTADPSGNWSCQLPQALPPGPHTVTIGFVFTDTTTDQLGPYNVSVPAPVTTTSTPKLYAYYAPASDSATSDVTPTVADATTPTFTNTSSTPASTEKVATAAQSSWNAWWLAIPAVLIVAIITILIVRRYHGTS